MGQSNLRRMTELSLSLKIDRSPERLLKDFVDRSTEVLKLAGAAIIDNMDGLSSTSSIVHQAPESWDIKSEIYDNLLALQDHLKHPDSRQSSTFFEMGNFWVSAFQFEPQYLLLSYLSQKPTPDFQDAFNNLLLQLLQLYKCSSRYSETLKVNQRLKLATRSGSIGTWELELSRMKLTWDEQMFELFEVDPASDLSYGMFRSLVFEEDLAELEAVIQNYLDTTSKDAIDFQFRIQTPNGNVKKLVAHTLINVDALGNRHLFGITRDITELETARTQSLYRSQLESLIIDLSMKVIRSGPNDLDRVTNEALEVIGKFVGADRAYKFDYDFDNHTCNNTHEWCNSGIAPEIDHLQGVPVGDLEIWVTSHQRGLPMYVAQVRSLPDDNMLRQILEPQGIKSLVTIPLMDDENCSGFIGFDAVNHERHWNKVDINLLKLVAELLVNAKRKADNEIKIQEAHKALIESRDTARFLAKEAAAAATAKSRFVASVSHEIRTPLHAILGLADLSLTQTTNPELHKNISTIHKAGQTLLDLINDVLDFARSDANVVNVKHEPLSLNTLLDNLNLLFLPLATKKGLYLNFNIPPDIPNHVIGDELRIKQVLSNLLSNAIKFTDTGGVELNIDCSDCANMNSNSPIHLNFSIKDTGVGISKEDMSKIYDPFFQSEYASRNQLKGTGLGLAIAHLLTDKMGGALSVNSEVGKGTTFTLSLPLTRSKPQATQPVSFDRLSPTSIPVGIRILVAEDNPINQQLIKTYLKDSGLELDVVANGQEAVDKFQEHDYQMILMDCLMPELDGFEASKKIRTLEGIKKHTPIIAVTASATQDDREACLQAGMDEVITKPFSKSDLMKLIAEIANQLTVQ